VIRTRVGYAGGKLEDPTYHRLGDHTETLQVDYDPEKISYPELLDVFWAAHNPIAPSYSRQYRSVILYHDEKQRQQAQSSLEREAERRKAKLHTALEPLGEFYRAEDYHQKYLLRGVRSMLQELTAHYPDWRGVVDSTAAARVNGYLGGHGGPKQLEVEAPDLGLSDGALQRLRAALERSARWP